jgi:hypothetical protein
MGTSAFEFAGFDATEAAKACSSFRYHTPVDAEPTDNTICFARRIYWKSICPAAVIVDGLDVWPDLLKVCPDTINTEADYLRDSFSSLAAVLTCTHGDISPSQKFMPAFRKKEKSAPASQESKISSTPPT